MNEELVRALVRETIARHLAGGPGREPDPDVPLHPLNFTRHSSHYRYTLPESAGPCQIEPGVTCTHCGYCESHGH